MTRTARASAERRQSWRAAWALSAGLLTSVLVTAAPAAGQAGSAMASSGVLVRVPPVAQMAVEPLQPRAVRLASSSSTVEGAFRISVRANHGWGLVVAAAPGTGDAGQLWIRAEGEDGTDEFRLLEAGQEMMVARGGMGATEIRLEYRWLTAGGAEPRSVPLTYTLASR